MDGEAEPPREVTRVPVEADVVSLAMLPDGAGNHFWGARASRVLVPASRRHL